MWPFDKLFPKKKPEPEILPTPSESTAPPAPISKKFNLAGYDITVSEDAWNYAGYSSAKINISPNDENKKYLLDIINTKIQTKFDGAVYDDGTVSYGEKWGGIRKPKEDQKEFLSFDSLCKVISEFIEKNPSLSKHNDITNMRQLKEEKSQERAQEQQERYLNSRVNPILDAVKAALKKEGINLKEHQEANVAKAIGEAVSKSR